MCTKREICPGLELNCVVSILEGPCMATDDGGFCYKILFLLAPEKEDASCL